MQPQPTLLHPSDPRAPKYWRYETSGQLSPVIEAYLFHRPMDELAIGIMRAYLQQWIDSPVWDGGSDELDQLRRSVRAIATREDIDTWLQDALNAGIDPL